MTQLIEYELENGETVVLEIDEDGGETIPVAQKTGVVKKANQTFDKALESIKPAAAAVILKLKSLHEPPDEIALEFGIKLNATAGAVVASTSLEANYKVTMTWKREAKNE
jgi:DNA-directed RNA polymerase specialized sigma24 family protein